MIVSLSRQHENGTRRSKAQFSHRTRAKPRLAAPHIRNSAELALDEAGKPAAVGAVGGLAQEGFQVLADDAMEDGALRVPGLIRGGAHGRRASEARAVRGSVRRTALPPGTARRAATGIGNAALR